MNLKIERWYLKINKNKIVNYGETYNVHIHFFSTQRNIFLFVIVGSYSLGQG